MPALGWIMIGGTVFAAFAVAAEVWLYCRLHPHPLVRVAPRRVVPAGQDIRVTRMKVIPALPACRAEAGQ